MRLFDADPFSKPHRKYRDERRPKEREAPPEVVQVTLGERWVLVSGGHKSPPEVHAVKKRQNGVVVTYCNVIKTPLTGEPGTVAGACPACLEKGARP